MIQFPPLLPQDKANHIVYGAAVGLLAQGFCHAFGVTEAAVLSPLLFAITIGALKEAVDSYENRQAARSGLPTPHGVEWLDAISTSIGGAAISLSAYLQGP